MMKPVGQACIIAHLYQMCNYAGLTPFLKKLNKILKGRFIMQSGQHEEKICVKLYDIDHCLHHAVKSNKSKPQSEWLIQSNEAFFSREIQEIKDKGYTVVVIASGSNRQCYRTDKVNAENNFFRSSTASFLIIQAYYQAQLGPSVSVVVDLLLTADIYGDKPAGESYKAILQSEFKTVSEEKHADSILDNKKISLLFARMHRAASFHSNSKIDIYFADDSSDIISSLDSFFTYHGGQRFIPNNISLIMRQYKKGNIKDERPTITGTGEVCTHYDWALLYICNLSQYFDYMGMASTEVDIAIAERTVHDAHALEKYFLSKCYYVKDCNHSSLQMNPFQFTDDKGLDAFFLMVTKEIIKLKSNAKITKKTCYTTAIDLLRELDIAPSSILGNELAAHKTDAQVVVAVNIMPDLIPLIQCRLEEFFKLYDVDSQSWFKRFKLASDLQKERKDISINDIILHAMKDPVNSLGAGGNRTAKILKYHFGVDVGMIDQQFALYNDHLNYELGLQFYEAWKNIVAKEKTLLNEFEVAHSDHIKDKSNTNLPRTIKKEEKRYYGLVWHTAHAKSSWYNQLLGGLAVPGFYSGKRSCALFKEKFKLDVKNENCAEKIVEDRVLRK